MPSAAAVSAPLKAAPRRMSYAPLEGLLRGLEVPEGSLEMMHIIRLCGGTEHAPQEVPVERFRDVLLFLARQRFPMVARPEALFRVGGALFEGYRRTLLGRIQLAALHLIGPERLMRKIPEFVGRNSNFGERTAQQVGPNEWRVHFKGVPLPGDYYNGMVNAALRAAGVEAPQTRWEQNGPEEMTFHVRW